MAEVELWHPRAVRDLAPAGSWGTYTDRGEPKFLLHTTEGPRGAYTPDPQAGDGRRYYGNTGTWPHFTVARRNGVWLAFQHLPANRSAMSLRNLSGGVQTNRDYVVQVEIAWKAAEIGDLPRDAPDALAVLADVLAWDHRVRGTPLRSTVRWVAYPKSYGSGAGQRLTGPAWDAYAGVLGHQHAAENDHGDPGDFPIGELLQLTRQHLQPLEDEDVEVELTKEQVSEIGAESARATLTLLWAQMCERPAGAAEDWHRPRQDHAGAVLRRTYEVNGGIWRDVADLRAGVDALAGISGSGDGQGRLSVPAVLDAVFSAGGGAAVAELVAAGSTRLAAMFNPPPAPAAPEETSS